MPHSFRGLVIILVLVCIYQLHWLVPTKEGWEIISGIVSIAIALAALIFSIHSFNKQQDRAETQAKGNVRPLLMMKSQKYIDVKSIEVANYGVGPAVVKTAKFYRIESENSTNDIVKLFDLEITWEIFTNLPSNRAIAPQEKIVLVGQSSDHLKSQGFTDERSLQLLKKWQEQKAGIKVEIEYLDILGNEMPKLTDTL